MNQVYLVTGASSDIGMRFIREAARKEETARFYAHYRTPGIRLEEIRAELGDRMELIQADLAEPEGAFRVIEAVRETPTHILHLPAGRIEYKRMRQIEAGELQREMQVQVYSLLELYKAFLPKMAKAGYGRSVAVVSSYTVGTPPQFLGVYITTKYALLGLVKSAAAEYVGKGVFINALSPDMVDTKFLEPLDSRIVEMAAKKSPLGRNITVEEVVAAVEFLLADGNPMHGENVHL